MESGDQVIGERGDLGKVENGESRRLYGRTGKQGRWVRFVNTPILYTEPAACVVLVNAPRVTALWGFYVMLYCYSTVWS